ncbi:MAG TPA: methylated-DNA--[protein]-cysteine S-methyltransferase [Thermoplasmata archaeon]|nr:methylated-DNA--[protein]-cysteine S-methyltransferase [Thermoplasmata archaeon]
MRDAIMMAVTGNEVIRAEIRWSERGVTGIHLYHGPAVVEGEDPFGAVAFIQAHLDGRPAGMPRLDLHLSPFRRRVYGRLVRIPWGEVMTYGELARELGTSPRAVGRAMATNPVPIIYPCHRVIAAGHIGGFGGAVGIKVYLLEHEARTAPLPGDAERQRW